LSTILLWNILRYCTHESHNIVCWLIVPMRLSVDYWHMLTIMSVAILLWNILWYCTHESHNIVCWLLTYADNNVCWVLYCYEIFYDIVPMWATILSVDYCRMLTIMSVGYRIAMKYFTILYPCEPQYCLLTTDVCWQ
jgi:carbon starvation protein CstA